jgi:hypothetical protein
LLLLYFLIFDVFHLFAFFTMLLVKTKRVSSLSISLILKLIFSNLKVIYFSTIISNWWFLSEWRSASYSFGRLIIKTSSEIASWSFKSLCLSFNLVIFHVTSFELSICKVWFLWFVIIYCSQILKIIREFSYIILSVIILIIRNTHFSLFLLSITRSPLVTIWRLVS